MYRRACGNLRLWSGGDNQATNERVRRSRRTPSVRFAVFGPGIPCLEAWGAVNKVSRGTSPVRCPSAPALMASKVDASSASLPRITTWMSGISYVMGLRSSHDAGQNGKPSTRLHVQRCYPRRAAASHNTLGRRVWSALEEIRAEPPRHEQSCHATAQQVSIKHASTSGSWATEGRFGIINPLGGPGAVLCSIWQITHHQYRCFSSGSPATSQPDRARRCFCSCYDRPPQSRPPTPAR